ncbi:hypothetical protein L2U69_11790 [Zavarzinia compransoris]|uniref:hypothetical protein n=1 Tax=Zavarzinia marina TaxID=2911065 RepID=UPI001F1CFC56|nr:hypothetical protein [Zavarzinia marina]MCF4166328.1 hypothetical protein [Zavarzinia marina]
MARTIQFQGRTIRVPDNATDEQVAAILQESQKSFLDKAADTAGDVGTFAAGTARALQQGATFGFGDEIQAGIRAPFDYVFGSAPSLGEAYRRNVDEYNADDANFQEEHPIIHSLASGTGGAVAGLALPGGIASQGVKGIGGVARMAGIGAAEGALAGYGNAAPDQRAEGALTGGLIGGTLGAVIPATLGVAGRVAGKLFGPEAAARRDLARAVQRDEMTVEGLASRQRDLAEKFPGEATIMDAGGENVRGLAERVAQTPGGGRKIVIPFLTGRQKTQITRLGNEIGDTLDAKRTAAQAVEETMDARARMARPLYEKAMSFDAAASPELMKAFNAETSRGFGFAALKSAELRNLMATEYGVEAVEDAPAMVLIDGWKRIVDDKIDAALRAGNANAARVMRAMKQRVIDVADQVNPDYAAARNAWAGPTRYLDAIEKGKGIFARTMSAESWRSLVSSMSAAEREAMRIGAISAIRNRVGNDAARMPDLTKYLRSPENREKILALMPDFASARRWADVLSFETGISELTGRALGNSATYRRMAERADADDLVHDLALTYASGGAMSNLWSKLVGGTAKRMRDTMRARTDEELARMLTNTNTDAAERALLNPLERVGLSYRQTNALTGFGRETILDQNPRAPYAPLPGQR